MSLKARLASWLGIPGLESQVAAFDNRVTEPDKRLGAEVASLRSDTLEALALCHDILGKLETLEGGQAQKLAAAVLRIEALSKEAVDAATHVIAQTRTAQQARPQGWDSDLEDSLTTLADLIPPA